MSKRAMVLLSGGLDSSMVLVQALRDGCEVAALTVFYGQPAQAQEESAAGAVAKRFGVERIRVYTCDTLPRPTQLGTSSAEDRGIISTAFVPGRNAVMLTIAAAHAAVRWPDGKPFELWIGACHDDIGGFPDCRKPFLEATANMLTHALAREVSIVAPMLGHTKAAMLRACRHDATMLEAAIKKAQAAPMQGLCHQCAEGERGEWNTSGEFDADPANSPLVAVGEGDGELDLEAVKKLWAEGQ